MELPHVRPEGVSTAHGDDAARVQLGLGEIVAVADHHASRDVTSRLGHDPPRRQIVRADRAIEPGRIDYVALRGVAVCQEPLDALVGVLPAATCISARRARPG